MDDSGCDFQLNIKTLAVDYKTEGLPVPIKRLFWPQDILYILTAGPSQYKDVQQPILF